MRAGLDLPIDLGMEEKRTSSLLRSLPQSMCFLGVGQGLGAVGSRTSEGPTVVVPPVSPIVSASQAGNAATRDDKVVGSSGNLASISGSGLRRICALGDGVYSRPLRRKERGLRGCTLGDGAGTCF